MDILIHTDGGARGNPGPAACAFVIIQNDQVIHEANFYLGNKTNNVAEYQGLLMALEWALESHLNFSSLQINMDSLLVVNQVKGIFKVKETTLKKLYLEVIDKLKELRQRKIRITLNHIYREDNSTADKLVNQCLDEQSARETVS